MDWVKCIPTKLEKKNYKFFKNNDKSDGNPPKILSKKLVKKNYPNFNLNYYMKIINPRIKSKCIGIHMYLAIFHEKIFKILRFFGQKCIGKTFFTQNKGSALSRGLILF